MISNLFYFFLTTQQPTGLNTIKKKIILTILTACYILALKIKHTKNMPQKGLSNI